MKMMVKISDAKKKHTDETKMKMRLAKLGKTFKKTNI